MAENYLLQVTAGSSYDINKHQVVPVNCATPIRIESEHASIELNVRIQTRWAKIFLHGWGSVPKSYRGLPRSSPTTSDYFRLAPHAQNNDQYSIAFAFTPTKRINGNDLLFGNDFDHPVRDRLPPGFGTAFKIVKWAIDPGLDGDVYADRPYLYGPAASSVNTLFVGKSKQGDGRSGLLFAEGGDDAGLAVRRELGVPDTEAGRRKFFLNEERRKEWNWEAGREYGCDFFNPYLDFNHFALRLPGFTLPIMKYWDGQPLSKDARVRNSGEIKVVPKRSHSLRYTLKNRATDDVLMVVLFTLYLSEDVDSDGVIKHRTEAPPNAAKKVCEKKESVPVFVDDDVD